MLPNFRVFAPLAIAVASASLAACSSVSDLKVWPFNQSSPVAAQGPANATEYQCNEGKHFYVRMLDNGNAAWLIYPDREVSLGKSGTGTRYTNGVATLDINGGEASLVDGPLKYSDCKVPVTKKP